MAEEYDRDALAAEIEAQAAQMAAQAEQAAQQVEQSEQVADSVEQATEVVEQIGKHAAPVAESVAAQATETIEQAVAEEAPQPGETTAFIEMPAQDDAAEAAPTGVIEPATESFSAPVNETTPMPNPYPAPQQTSPIAEPASTMSGFDVPVAQEIAAEEPASVPTTPAAPEAPLAQEAPANVNDPYAAASAAAGFGAAASSYAQPIPQAQQVPPQPVEPWRQASQQGYQQASYANPDYRASTYQNAVQHQPYAADPQVNAYEQAMPAPLTQLTGGMKFGWFVVGFLLGIPGMVIAWLVNVDKHPQVKRDAILWSVIGFVVACVLAIIASIALAGAIAGMVVALSDGGYGGYYF